MTIAKSILIKQLTERWAALGKAVPYQLMAEDAADAVSNIIDMLEGALLAKESSWPTHEPEWYGLYLEWKKEMSNKNTGISWRVPYSSEE